MWWAEHVARTILLFLTLEALEYFRINDGDQMGFFDLK